MNLLGTTVLKFKDKWIWYISSSQINS